MTTATFRSRTRRCAGACSPATPRAHSPLYQDIKLKSDQDETTGIILVAPDTTNPTLAQLSRELSDRFLSSRDLSIIIFADRDAATKAIEVMDSTGKVAQLRKSPHSLGLATNRGVLQPDSDIFIPPAAPVAKEDK